MHLNMFLKLLLIQPVLMSQKSAKQKNKSSILKYRVHMEQHSKKTFFLARFLDLYRLFKTKNNINGTSMTSKQCLLLKQCPKAIFFICIWNNNDRQMKSERVIFKVLLIIFYRKYQVYIRENMWTLWDVLLFNGKSYL